MKVLIAGGSGFVGQHVEKALISRGHEVEIISRMAGPRRITWNKLKKEETLPECDVLINLCGEFVFSMLRKWNDNYRKDIWESRVGTNKLLVELIKNGRNKPKIWIVGTAEGYYPRNNTVTYDESFVLKEPKGFMETLCYEWEQSSLLPDDLNIRHVGIRLGPVFGKNGGLIQQSYWPFYLGLGGIIGSGQQFISWVHVNDAANLILHAIENDNVKGFINGTAPNPCTMAEFVTAFGSALWRPTLIPVPEFVIRFLVGEERAPFILEGCKILPKKTMDMGYKFEFPCIEECMENIVNS